MKNIRGKVEMVIVLILTIIILSGCADSMVAVTYKNYEMAKNQCVNGSILSVSVTRLGWSAETPPKNIYEVTAKCSNEVTITFRTVERY